MTQHDEDEEDPDTPFHILRSNERLGWWTGRNRDGKRILCGRHGDRTFLLRFSKRGRLKESMPLDGDPRDAIDIEKPIRVFEFELPEFDVGVSTLPREYRAFLDDTWSFDESERARWAVVINDWRESGHFIFHWDGVEYQCDEEGNVLTQGKDEDPEPEL